MISTMKVAELVKILAVDADSITKIGDQYVLDLDVYNGQLVAQLDGSYTHDGGEIVFDMDDVVDVEHD
jgi:hypothetical protein